MPVPCARTTYLVIVALALVWCGAIVGAPFLTSVGSESGAFVYRAYARVCHQLPSRTLHLWDHPFAVCSRCTGIYAGFLLGSLLYPVFRTLQRPEVPERWFVLFSLSPMLVDVTGGVLGLHAVSIETRLATGLVFGVLISFVIIPAATEAVIRLIPVCRPSPPHVKGASDA